MVLLCVRMQSVDWNRCCCCYFYRSFLCAALFVCSDSPHSEQGLHCASSIWISLFIEDTIRTLRMRIIFMGAVIYAAQFCFIHRPHVVIISYSLFAERGGGAIWVLLCSMQNSVFSTINFIVQQWPNNLELDTTISTMLNVTVIAKIRLHLWLLCYKIKLIIVGWCHS